MPSWFFVVFYTLFGLAIGSFLNVVIARLPEQVPLTGRSRCPRCEHPIRPRDDIPLVSWILLRARCRDCGARISARYPAVEAATAVAWLFLAVHFHMTVPRPIDVVLLAAVSLSIALALIDLDTLLLPDRLVGSLAVITVLGLVAQSALDGQYGPLRTAAVGAVAVGGFYLLLWLITAGRGIGFGDVKLAPTLGALTGWFGLGAAAVGFISAFVISMVPIIVLAAAGRLRRRMRIPFGPFLLAGAWVGILYGPALAGWYWHTFGL